jgi:hypothetical protein
MRGLPGIAMEPAGGAVGEVPLEPRFAPLPLRS